MWGIFVDNQPLAVLNRETGISIPMIFEDSKKPAAIAEVMNKELLNIDVAVRPVIIQNNFKEE